MFKRERKQCKRLCLRERERKQCKKLCLRERERERENIVKVVFEGERESNVNGCV
jgi:hypothetical protein